MGIVVIMYWSIFMIIFSLLPITYVISTLELDFWPRRCLAFSVSAALCVIGYIADHVDRE